ncbi:hypothetical protein HELRODRAFT_174815 [Helobdella robusta]|uniref:Uncharacterized protein n=1 Tax=Helobdella robusta TaxID=6412 RepID=T1F8I3_HELRO|nr:hypothetical protein HELRODRAFT_174815 [Helobdella robusta]ESO01268.1 hypothetical protein HELRODRAFT_174815 [Helobdella robusta]
MIIETIEAADTASTFPIAAATTAASSAATSATNAAANVAAVGATANTSATDVYDDEIEEDGGEESESETEEKVEEKETKSEIELELERLIEKQVELNKKLKGFERGKSAVAAAVGTAKLGGKEDELGQEEELDFETKRLMALDKSDIKDLKELVQSNQRLMQKLDETATLLEKLKVLHQIKEDQEKLLKLQIIFMKYFVTKFDLMKTTKDEAFLAVLEQEEQQRKLRQQERQHQQNLFLRQQLLQQRQNQQLRQHHQQQQQLNDEFRIQHRRQEQTGAQQQQQQQQLQQDEQQQNQQQQQLRTLQLLQDQQRQLDEQNRNIQLTNEQLNRNLETNEELLKRRQEAEKQLEIEAIENELAKQAVIKRIIDKQQKRIMELEGKTRVSEQQTDEEETKKTLKSKIVRRRLEKRSSEKVSFDKLESALSHAVELLEKSEKELLEKRKKTLKLRHLKEKKLRQEKKNLIKRFKFSESELEKMNEAKRSKRNLENLPKDDSVAENIDRNLIEAEAELENVKTELDILAEKLNSETLKLINSVDQELVDQPRVGSSVPTVSNFPEPIHSRIIEIDSNNGDKLILDENFLEREKKLKQKELENILAEQKIQKEKEIHDILRKQKMMMQKEKNDFENLKSVFSHTHHQLDEPAPFLLESDKYIFPGQNKKQLKTQQLLSQQQKLKLLEQKQLAEQQQYQALQRQIYAQQQQLQQQRQKNRQQQKLDLERLRNDQGQLRNDQEDQLILNVKDSGSESLLEEYRNSLRDLRLGDEKKFFPEVKSPVLKGNEENVNMKSSAKEKRNYVIEQEDDDDWLFTNASQEEQNLAAGRTEDGQDKRQDLDQIWARDAPFPEKPGYDYKHHTYPNEQIGLIVKRRKRDARDLSDQNEEDLSELSRVRRGPKRFGRKGRKGNKGRGRRQKGRRPRRHPQRRRKSKGRGRGGGGGKRRGGKRGKRPRVQGRYRRDVEPDNNEKDSTHSTLFYSTSASPVTDRLAEKLQDDMQFIYLSNVRLDVILDRWSKILKKYQAVTDDIKNSIEVKKSKEETNTNINNINNNVNNNNINNYNNVVNNILNNLRNNPIKNVTALRLKNEEYLETMLDLIEEADSELLEQQKLIQSWGQQVGVTDPDANYDDDDDENDGDAENKKKTLNNDKHLSKRSAFQSGKDDSSESEDKDEEQDGEKDGEEDFTHYRSKRSHPFFDWLASAYKYETTASSGKKVVDGQEDYHRKMFTDVRKRTSAVSTSSRTFTATPKSDHPDSGSSSSSSSDHSPTNPPTANEKMGSKDIKIMYRNQGDNIDKEVILVRRGNNRWVEMRSGASDFSGGLLLKDDDDGEDDDDEDGDNNDDGKINFGKNGGGSGDGMDVGERMNYTSGQIKDAKPQ